MAFVIGLLWNVRERSGYYTKWQSTLWWLLDRLMGRGQKSLVHHCGPDFATAVVPEMRQRFVDFIR
jgi:hypothetical protein